MAIKRPAPSPADRRRTLLISAGLLALIVLVYAPVRQYGLVSLDDPLYITQNPHVLGGLTWDSFWWALTSRHAMYWVPLTWMSYMAEVQLFGVRPDVMHVTNVLLHGVNTLLLFWWLRQTTGSMWRSACAAALFAVHPLHVESVAWVTERKDVLSTCFLLLALRTYTTYAVKPTFARHLALCGLAVAGLMAKPMIVTLPFLLLLCDVWPLGRAPLDVRSRDARVRWWALVREKWALFAIAGVASTVAFATQRGAMVAQEVFPLGLRVENAIVSAVIYLGQAVWPVALIAWYAYPETIPLWHVIAALAALVAVSVAVMRATRFPYLAVGWFWYLGTLVPVSGLVQVGLQPRADRFTYVPFIGLSLAVVWGLSEIMGRSRFLRLAPAALGIAVSCVFSVMAHRQVSYWQDGLTLWQHAADVTTGRGAAQAQFELGRMLSDAGRLDEAITHLRQAIQLKPEWAGAHGLLGTAFLKGGRKADAKSEYEIALRLDPNQLEAQLNFGVILAEEGQLEAALPHFAEAVRLNPEFESAHANLAVALMRLGRKAEAIQEFQSTLRINPANALAKRMLDTIKK